MRALAARAITYYMSVAEFQLTATQMHLLRSALAYGSLSDAKTISTESLKSTEASHVRATTLLAAYDEGDAETHFSRISARVGDRKRLQD